MELNGKRYYTHSGNLTGKEPMFEGYVGKYPFLPLSDDRIFKTSIIGDTNRAECTEVKMLEFVAKQKKTTDEFTITLMSEKCVCPSCSGVIKQFRAKYPKAKLDVIAGKEERNIRGERKRAIQNDGKAGKNPH